MDKKIPEIRFKGFTDDWEERKLKELGDIQTGNTPPTSDSDNYSLDGVLWVTPTDIKSLVISNTAKKLSQVGVTKARIAKAGSILVTSIASIGKNTLLRMDAGFNQQINSLTPTSENDSYFLLTQSEKWSEKMKQTAASATMQIVNKTDFSNISTYVPVHKEEQEKIGSFFKQLDDTIALHQRKLDLLKEQKKGFLQKMFPKAGEKIPELRFKGFTDDWEERKLGELASFSKGNGYTKNDLVEFGDPIILYGRLYTKYETVIEKVDTFVNKKDKSIISEGSEVIVPASGESSEDISRASVVGKSGIILGGDLNIIKPVNYIDSIFLALTISNGSQQKEMSKRAQGKSVVHLHNSDLKQVNILYPKLEEQQKIGSFFKQLDNTIALHQRKLDLLKKQKKGFLQKMFI
ncbi:restriction endonuclease subunit S [Brochothrix thermosphacta]|uniref:restriction endonuclease subunit S n=1 Tax=Brochothrix thermosphacta TaxID=2756 RepID=UPI000E7432BE|nr:restriction endonuclease subunit S [Brochothrix thermosphacta]